MVTYRVHQSILFFVTVFGVIFLSGCASSPKAPIVDYREDRFTTLTEQLAIQRRKIEYLSSEVKELKRKFNQAQAEVKAPAVPTKKALPKVSKRMEAPKVPPAQPAASDNDDKSELVADSSFESMHLYFRGMQLRKEKKYDEAISAFREFYETFPDHVYADRAHYLVVRSLYDNREYQLAIVSANQMIGRYPHSFRIPEAIYYRSLSYQELGNREEAYDGFRELVQDFPKTESAKIARDQLGAMGQRSASAPKLLDRTTQ